MGCREAETARRCYAVTAGDPYATSRSRGALVGRDRVLSRYHRTGTPAATLYGFARACGSTSALTTLIGERAA